MNFSRDQLIQRIRSWAVLCKEQHLIENAYLFGSFIYQQGDQFNPGKSDFDIIVLLPQGATSPLSRVATLDKLVQLNYDLVRDLLSLLKRELATDRIASIIPVSDFELDIGVHKGSDPDLFQYNEFLDLLDEKANLSSLHSHSKVSQDSEHAVIQAIQCAQSFRNTYISISANQQRFTEPWNDDEDPLPKLIMRSAQQLNCYMAGQRGIFQYDVNRGTQFISELLGRYAKDDSEYTRLYNWLLVHRGRGIRKALEPRDLMLLWEILAIEAEKALRRSSPTSGRDESVDVGHATTSEKQPADGSSPIPAALSAMLPSNSGEGQQSSAKLYRQPDVTAPPTSIQRISLRLGIFLVIGAVVLALSAAVLAWNSCQRSLPPGMAVISAPAGVAPLALDIAEVTNEAFAGWLNQVGVRPDVKRVTHDGQLIIDLSGSYCAVEFNGNRYVARQGAASQPVVRVSWEGAQRYCLFEGKRLPTGKELSMAAYGPFDNRRYPWGDQQPDCKRAVYGRNTGLSCIAFGIGPANVKSTLNDVTADGFYDLGGNVAEWVADDDAQGHRFFGGDWGRTEKPMDKNSNFSHLKSEDGRAAKNPMGDNIGFRCALGLTTHALWTKVP